MRFLTKERQTIGLILVVGLVLYWLGLTWPFVLLSVGIIARYAPMPKVFNSWLSRGFVALLFTYALLAVAALVQCYIVSTSNFNTVALLLALQVYAGAWLFAGQSRRAASYRLFNHRDVYALVGSLLFIVPFLSIIGGSNTTQKITHIAASQITDSVVHNNIINGLIETQHLTYRSNPLIYYPSGFHFATAFMERSLFGNVPTKPWNELAKIYFAQYLIFSLSLLYAGIYFAYAMLSRFMTRVRNLSDLAIAVSMGFGMTIMHMFLFVNSGFLNYFYVCASLLVAMTYLLELKAKPLAVTASYAVHFEGSEWPLFAYLLLSFGASFSYPLLAPVILLTAAVSLLPTLPRSFKNYPRYIKGHLWIAGGIILNLSSVLLQSVYATNGSNAFNAGGAISNFNIVFLLIGLVVAGFVFYKNTAQSAGQLGRIILPFLLIILVFMAVQYFSLGMASYYLIKLTMPFEMILLALGAASLVQGIEVSNHDRMMLLTAVPLLVIFTVMATMAMTKTPFVEIRTLFRNSSQLGSPPHLDEDVRTIAFLGSQNKLQDYNMTILHYDAVSNRLYAQIETALWADSLSSTSGSQIEDSSRKSKTQEASGACFNQQFYVLAYGQNLPSEQAKLVQAVRECIRVAIDNKHPYYIVTDGDAVVYMKQLFGEKAQYVY